MLALQQLLNSMTAEQRQALEDERQRRQQMRAQYGFSRLTEIARACNGNFITHQKTENQAPEKTQKIKKGN